MTRYHRFLPPEFDTADSYLSHPATYYHLGRESSRRGIIPDVQFGFLANQLPDDLGRLPRAVSRTISGIPASA